MNELSFARRFGNMVQTTDPETAAETFMEQMVFSSEVDDPSPLFASTGSNIEACIIIGFKDESFILLGKAGPTAGEMIVIDNTLSAMQQMAFLEEIVKRVKE